jgi:hypothetical protein
MAQQQLAAVPPGWIGGFAQSNPAFDYPHPDLSSLKLLHNMDNIDKLQRQQKVLWPEFSWQTVPGIEALRCFQMFAPDISRLGYTDEGRVYSIICPQQGACSPIFGCLNIEVSVTGNRGWVDEKSKLVAADLTAEGKIWFTPGTHANLMVKNLWKLFVLNGRKFPDDKANAIIVTLHKTNEPSQPILQGLSGETTSFKSPGFAQHQDKAWAVANLEVQIGPIVPTNDPLVDEFNWLVMFAFNIASGNLLTVGNVLTWNVWFEDPTLVDQQEWKDHAEKWRDSIDADHGAPCGQGTPPRYFNGNLFQADDAVLVELIQKIIEYLEKHWPAAKLNADQKSMRDKITGYLAKHRERLAAVTSP